MKAEVPELSEEELATWLAAYDEGLLAEPASTQLPSPEVMPRLEKNLACLRRLHRVWQTPHETHIAELARELAPGLSRTPTRLGRFEIRRELGQGGYGIVFLAYDPQLGREVALKIPRPDTLVTPELRIRFHQEAQAAAGLDHPNLVSVYEAGEIAAICYIASAYCPGETLASWLRQRSDPVPFNEAATLVAALADGVQHAHSRGVLHRDLKPANILLTSVVRCPLSVAKPASEAPYDHGQRTTDNGPIPKITDFGLAKLLEGNTKSLTQSGAIVGTPQYMAPEQAQGRAEAITTAVDVYALGAILYELLTGRPPFQADTVLNTLNAVVFTEPVPPGRLRLKVPRDLETICLKCLHKEPERRYSSAAALAEDLRHFQSGEPVRARAVGSAERLWLWAKRKPAMASLTAALAVAVLGGSAVATWQWYRADKNRRQAEKNYVRAEENFQLAKQAVDRYYREVSDDLLLNQRGMHPLRRRLLEAALVYYQGFLDQHRDDRALQAELAQIYGRVSHIHELIGSKEAAVEARETAAALHERLASDYASDSIFRERWADDLNSLGGLYFAVGRTAAAETAIHNALNLSNQLADGSTFLPSCQLGRASSYTSLAKIYTKTSRPKDAESAHQKSLEILEGLVRHDPAVSHRQQLALAHNNVGVFYWLQHRMGDAEKALKRALELRAGLAADNAASAVYRYDLAGTHNNLGLLYHGIDQANAAEVHHRHSLSLHEQLVREHPGISDYQFGLAKSHNNLGLVNWKMRRLDEAEKCYRKAIENYEQLQSANPTVNDFAMALAGGYDNLGALLRDQGKLDDALAWHARAEDTLKGVLQREPRHTEARLFLKKAHISRALTFIQLDRPANSIPDWDAAIALEDGPERPHWQIARAAALARSGEHAQAVVDADAIGTSFPGNGRIWFNVACVHGSACRVVDGDAALATPERKRLLDRYAASALEALRKAYACGYFADAARITRLKQEPDFEPLRSRADFKELLREVDKMTRE